MKNFIVTGASKGIGKEIAINIAQKGHTVFAIARSTELLKQLKEEETELINIISCDLTEDEQVKEFCTEFKHSKFDGIINNAGSLINKKFLETDIDEWKKMMDLNLYTAIRLIKAVKKQLNRNAHIVNISSMGGFQGSAKFPGLSAYSASKGALTILSECLAAEFSEDAVSVNCLCLGAVQTEMLEQAFPGLKAPVSPEQMGSYIADFALNGHQYFNGQVLPVAQNNPE